MTAALLVDLDDTLFPQATFLDQAWREVAAAAGERSRGALDPARMVEALVAAAAGGSDRGGIIDRAVAQVGAPGAWIPALVDVFRSFRPVTLPPYPGVGAALTRLAGRLPVVVVTDGVPAQQRAKLAATGLGDLVDAVVCTDDAGRRFRKPHRHGFRTALRVVGADAVDSVMVGDRPDKDQAGALAVGLRAIRVRQGEHRHLPDHPGTWATVATTPEALALVARPLLERVG